MVHDTPAAASGSGVKMLCADLVYNSETMRWEGAFEYVPSYTAFNYGTSLGPSESSSAGTTGGMGMGMDSSSGANFAALWHTDGLEMAQDEDSSMGKGMGMGMGRGTGAALSQIASQLSVSSVPAVAVAVGAVCVLVGTVVALVVRCRRHRTGYTEL